MTYGELFVFVENLRAKLPQRAISVLYHLIAACIDDGSNEIELSISRLAANLGMSLDPVRDAAIRLEGLIHVQAAAGVSMRWTLPKEWFEPQRSLFEVRSAVDKRSHPARNQEGTLLETRRVPCEKPGRYLTRNQEGAPGNQGGDPGNQEGLSWKPGGSLRDTRRVPEQNQQLSGDPAQIRSDRILSSDDHSGTDIYQIVAQTKIPVALKREGEILSQAMRSFFDRHGADGPVPTGPSEGTLARILALAPLETLLKRLEEMESEKLGRPKKWVWFLLLFAQDLCGIGKDAMLQALTKQSERKPPRTAPDPIFTQQLLDQTAAGLRKVR